MAMALWASTRLWLGGAVSACRDGSLIARLIEQVRRCAFCRPLLFCVDGFVAYVSAIQDVFPSGRSNPPYHPGHTKASPVAAEEDSEHRVSSCGIYRATEWHFSVSHCGTDTAWTFSGTSVRNASASYA